MKNLTNRDDVSLLVNTFYGKIRANELLGPIFNAHIAEHEWPAHLEKLTDFWETKIFGIPKFKGNPTLKHTRVDQNLNNTIAPKHFEEWLRLWFETIDELFEGSLAERAKNAARKMGTGQYLAILRNREEG